VATTGDFADFSETITIGTTHRFRFGVTVDDADEDLSAWDELWFTVKKTPEAETALLRLTTRDGTITRVEPTTDGIIEAVIEPEASAAIPNFHQVLYADIQGRDAAGDVWELARGVIVCLPRIGSAQ
jgi:hypothetical protein